MKNKLINFILPIFAISLSACGMLRGNGFSSQDSGSGEPVIESSGKVVSSKSSQSTCYHSYKLQSYYDATCTTNGLRYFICEKCGTEKEEVIPMFGHDFVFSYYEVEPTCYEYGIEIHKCSRCGLIQRYETANYGHMLNESVIDPKPTCTEQGLETSICIRCGEVVTTDIPALGHDYRLLQTGLATPAIYYCINGCGDRNFNLRASEVTDESKTHLVFNEDGGARFWGRPIGNDVALDENGTASEGNHEPIYNKNQTGDFFEFKITLGQEQADLMGDTELYCDAKPASYMGQNGQDFWKYKEIDEYDWTPGFYTDDDPSHYDENGNGLRIPYYRYVLFVDGQMVDFDSSISVPVSRGDPRGEYLMPYKFRFHSGVNTIRLTMSGGYRSTFYNFRFHGIGKNTPYDPTMEHDYQIGEKASDSALRTLSCSDCNVTGYELQAFDLTNGQKNVVTTDKNTRLGKNSIYDDIWNITGIESGTYHLYIKGQASQGNASRGYWCGATAIANGDTPINNGPNEDIQNDFKYKVKVDDNEYINVGNVEDNYAACGLNEVSLEWTTKPLAYIQINDGASTITLHNMMSSGYSIWVDAIRLIKIS